MSRARLIAILLAGAGAAGCSEKDAAPDPCAHATAGAPWLAFASGEASDGQDIHVIRADGTCRRALTRDAVWDGNPAWAPGGVVAFESDRAPRTSIWLAPIDAGAPRRLDFGELLAMSPAIAPDGATLAFEGRYVGSATNSIWLAPLAGGAPVERVPGAAYGNGSPVFSPDGATLYFISNRTGRYEIFRVPVAGGVDPVQITSGSRLYDRPTISPDGATLAYARNAGGTATEVVLVDPAGATTPVPLGIPGAAEPAFDPAGGRLAIRANYGLTTSIELVTMPAGAPVYRLTTGPGPDGAPAFDRPGR